MSDYRYYATLRDPIKVRCECEQCGKEYEYEVDVEVQTSGWTRDRAEDAALNILNKRLRAFKTLSPDNTACLRHIVPAPCPNCRHTQAWMNIYYRRRYITRLLWAAVITMSMLVILDSSIRSSATNILQTALVIGAISLASVGLIWVRYTPSDIDADTLPQLELPSRAQYL